MLGMVIEGLNFSAAISFPNVILLICKNIVIQNLKYIIELEMESFRRTLSFNPFIRQKIK